METNLILDILDFKNCNLVFGSDHRGYELKNKLFDWIKNNPNWVNLNVSEVGAYSEDRVDYPDIVGLFASEFKDKGILVCGSGFGVAIAANRYKNIRAVTVRTAKEVEMARLHNDANVICIGADFTDFDVAQHIVATFFRTKFEGGRHAERVAKLGGKLNGRS